MTTIHGDGRSPLYQTKGCCLRETNCTQGHKISEITQRSRENERHTDAAAMKITATAAIDSATVRPYPPSVRRALLEAGRVANRPTHVVHVPTVGQSQVVVVDQEPPPYANEGDLSRLRRLMGAGMEIKNVSKPLSTC